MVVYDFALERIGKKDMRRVFRSQGADLSNLER